jgi:hypothetical protein
VVSGRGTAAAPRMCSTPGLPATNWPPNPQRAAHHRSALGTHGINAPPNPGYPGAGT